MQNIMPAFKRKCFTGRRGEINATGMIGLVSEGRTKSQWGQWRRERSALVLRWRMRSCTLQAAQIFVYELVCASGYALLWGMFPPSVTPTLRRGGGGFGVAAVLTMSPMMSFMPLTVSTMTRGIMLMYHGTDEMAGTHCKQANTQARTLHSTQEITKSVMIQHNAPQPGFLACAKCCLTVFVCSFYFHPRIQASFKDVFCFSNTVHVDEKEDN